jgi:hypothetical protein
VHIDVDRARVEREEQQVRRLALAMQELGIGLAHGVRDHAVADVATVDEQILRVAPRLRRLWRAGQSRQRHAAGTGFDRDARVRHFAPKHRRRALGQRLAAHVAAGAAVVLQ